MVFPNLKLLCFCDKSTPVMDVLYHLTLRMYFGRPRGTTGTAPLEEGLFEDTIVDPRGELDSSKAANEVMYLHARFVWEQEKQKPKL